MNVMKEKRRYVSEIDDFGIDVSETSYQNFENDLEVDE